MGQEERAIPAPLTYRYRLLRLTASISSALPPSFYVTHTERYIERSQRLRVHPAERFPVSWLLLCLFASRSASVLDCFRRNTYQAQFVAHRLINKLLVRSLNSLHMSLLSPYGAPFVSMTRPRSQGYGGDAFGYHAALGPHAGMYSVFALSLST
ncbi:hypothetical protein BD311DRAFT_771556 [Dichomitus squalens]|uniref:Uncharacterized protein n=1 Tax=Dichomitus squalens TaxID=114155 RepID=A0A4Q9M7J0_9APHY|nr:hypothetical protein BD311DRAFT_771556 [Dichomitus squalens]